MKHIVRIDIEKHWTHPKLSSFSRPYALAVFNCLLLEIHIIKLTRP
jgi:hypothetical protein